MVITRPLDGVQVVVTRPAHQAKGLMLKLADMGAEAKSFAVIDIEPIAGHEWPSFEMEQQQMLIFISQNAVIHFVASFNGEIPPSTQLVAVGAATAKCMKQHGLFPDIVAPPPAGSESLLALAEMQMVTGCHVMIVRGEDGRELLAETLRERGAYVTYLAVYRRAIVTHELQEIDVVSKMDWFVVTSVAGLNNLCQIVKSEAIKHKMLLAVSERIAQAAKALGFQHIVVTDDVSDEAVVKRIVEIGQSNGK